MTLRKYDPKHRSIWCSEYEMCLDKAVKELWPGWSCSECALWQKDESHKERSPVNMTSENARICLDCDEIFEGFTCPTCGRDTGSWPIAKWINARQRDIKSLHVGERKRKSEVDKERGVIHLPLKERR